MQQGYVAHGLRRDFDHDTSREFLKHENGVWLSHQKLTF
jgi:hypothetical protein